MVNRNCQLYWTDSFLGDTLWVCLQSCFQRDRPTPHREWVAPFHGLGSWTEKGAGPQLSSGIPSSPFPGCSYDTTDYLKLPPPQSVMF